MAESVEPDTAFLAGVDRRISVPGRLLDVVQTRIARWLRYYTRYAAAGEDGTSARSIRAAGRILDTGYRDQ